MGNSLPAEKALVVYWLPDVGIGPPNYLQHVHVPLLDILEFQKPDGSPQADVVILFKAEFASPAFITIPDGLMAELTPAPGATQSNVQVLRSKGVKVLLSITGAQGLGWHSLPVDQHDAFALWLRDEVLARYGLDGIDIDDEFSDAPDDSASFMRLAGTLRGINPSALLTKPLYNDMEYFKTPVPADNPYNPGKWLSEILDFGATMAYGGDASNLVQFAEDYYSIIVPDGSKDVGLGKRMCIGVQAGPPSGSWMTRIEVAYEVALWLGGAPLFDTPRVMGMMLFTFSQDIQQFTHDPQNSPGYMYPNPQDHGWQILILSGMWSGAALQAAPSKH